VLRCSEVSVERLGDDLHLSFGAAGSDTLKRGNDQGLVSRWNDRKLTSRYETTSRNVTQVFEVQRDGHLLVTVTLNPRDGAKVVHKRVFDRARAADSASSATP
jgi:hypothetical protein